MSNQNQKPGKQNVVISEPLTNATLVNRTDDMFSNATHLPLNGTNNGTGLPLNGTDLLSTPSPIASSALGANYSAATDYNMTLAPTASPAPTAYGSRYEYGYISGSFWRSARQVPRVGHTDQVAKLASDSQNEQADYVMGVMFICGLIFMFFTIWGFALLILKCCGKYKVGYLSGGNYKKELKNDGVPSPRPLRGRVCFGISALMFIVWAILFATVALTHVENTSYAIAKTAVDADTFLGNAETALDQFMTKAAATEDALQKLGGDLQNAINTLEKSGVDSAQQLAGTAKQTLLTLGQLKGMMRDKSLDLKDTLETGQNTFQNVDSTFSSVDLTAAKIASGVILTLVPFLLLVMMALVAAGINHAFIGCFTEWFLMPLFVLIVILLYLGCSVWAGATIADSDFCAGGVDQTPEDTLDQILQYKGYQPGDMEYNFATYVMEGCVPPVGQPAFEKPGAFLERLETIMGNAIAKIVALDEMMVGVGVKVLAKQYGFDFGALETALLGLQEQLADNIKVLKAVLLTLLCTALAQLYDELVHNATCTDATAAFVWMWTSMFAMALSGFFMLTFRAALYPVEDRGYNEEGFAVVGTEKGEDGPDTGTLDDDKEKPATAISRYEEVGDDNPFKDEAPMGGGEGGDDNVFKPTAKVW